MPTETEELSCSFCGKSESDVAALVAGPSVYICDECIGMCNDIVVLQKVLGRDWHKIATLADARRRMEEVLHTVRSTLDLLEDTPDAD